MHLLASPSPNLAMIALVATRSYFWAMRAVGVKVLKNKLSEYLRLAAGGERVLITDRDRVVAELRAPDVAGVPLSDGLLADAMRQGWVSAPLMTRAEPPARLPVAPTATLLAELAADRGDR